jgi:hypothetical protein
MTVQSTLHPHPRPVTRFANVDCSIRYCGMAAEFSGRLLLTALDARFRIHHLNSGAKGMPSSKSC